MLPAGMRNNNPGNIKYVGQAGTHPSVNTDQGDPQAVFASPEAGMAAMYQLLMRKYRGGKISANKIVGDKGGWTPGNYTAAANVARSAGIGPDDDIGLGDPGRAAKFMRALMLQEHGQASLAYTDAQISNAIGGGGSYSTNPQNVQQAAPAEDPYRADNPHSAHPQGSTLPTPQLEVPTQVAPSGDQFAGASATGSTGNPFTLAKGRGKNALKGMAGVGMKAPNFPAYQMPPETGAARIDQPAVATIDPQQAMAQRQQLAQILARLNQGSLV